MEFALMFNIEVVEHRLIFPTMWGLEFLNFDNRSYVSFTKECSVYRNNIFGLLHSTLLKQKFVLEFCLPTYPIPGHHILPPLRKICPRISFFPFIPYHPFWPTTLPLCHSDPSVRKGNFWTNVRVGDSYNRCASGGHMAQHVSSRTSHTRASSAFIFVAHVQCASPGVVWWWVAVSVLPFDLPVRKDSALICVLVCGSWSKFCRGGRMALYAISRKSHMSK